MGPIRLDDLHGERFELALELLASGGSFEYNGILLSLSDDKLKPTMEIAALSEWDIQNINEVNALADISRARDTVDRLRSESKDFAELAERHPPQFSLIYDYGTGAVEIARLVDGDLVWAEGSTPVK